MIYIDDTIYSEGGIIYAPDSMDSYQWIDCNSGEIIEMGTSPIYEPTESGSYSVEIGLGNCKLITECIDVIYSSNISEPYPNKLNIYPNPSTGNIYFNQPIKGKMKVLDIHGKSVFEIIV